jgi:polyisoprenoid-binding protein YceI
MRSLFTAVAALLALPAAASTWKIDPAHSVATFSVRHMMVSNVRGEFGKMSGVVQQDDKDLTKSSVEVTVDTTTINTREPKRDAHLKSPDFFEVEKYPTMTFKSTRITKVDESHLKVAGNLTLHGVTKPVVFDAEVTPETPAMGKTVRGVTATTKLNRKDFGLNWNKTIEAGGVLVGDEVVVNVEFELHKEGPGSAAAKDAPPSAAAK